MFLEDDHSFLDSSKYSSPNGYHNNMFTNDFATRENVNSDQPEWNIGIIL